MLGWHISVYQLERDSSTAVAHQLQKRALPDAHNLEWPQLSTGDRLAIWQSRSDGIRWIDDLLSAGRAFTVQRGGYPSSYVVAAADVLPILASPEGPPHARAIWSHDAADILTSEWAGKTVINSEAIADQDPDAWLLVAAWDES